MQRQFFRICRPRRDMALVSIILVCFLLLYFRGHRENFPKHLSLKPPTDQLDTSLTKLSGIWNASYAEYKYKNGWSVPDDPGFIRYIQEKWLHKPSGINPNLPTKSYSQYGEDTYVKKLLQDRQNGFFLEAGALDGMRFSNTLGLELTHNWTGLLVEPDPSSFATLLKRKRNAYAMRACLSADKSEVLTFIHNTHELAIAALENTNRQKQNIDKERIQVQCFPLYSILLAVGRTKIDFFSLDVEGAEQTVLESIPMDKVDIGLFVIEYQHSDKAEKARRLEKMRDFFTKLGGYKYVGTHADMDAVFQKI